ncbi:uncharacterized protein Z518_05820 [Rhinocladiella mackenziei CBS 650.93]|uniref:Major facilitator superfamily (MFS) profile domain-containing protein n=1 Tax=Rhinocladiella mackenziei CBS 650.93 TaxID=1442369 RepID=A0A0D2IGS5_9EURO|nr:uncharacterized protein Z518_05820 [Rhinocladiella mackenziei CBS 650.93]KIX04949.1 hypothetical protein Z518_05820 [Rhinocladiella mackenziei CBS 650.93]
MDTHSQIVTAAAVVPENFHHAGAKAVEKNEGLKQEQHELEERHGNESQPRSENAEAMEYVLSARNLTALITAIRLITFTTGFQMQIMSPLLPYVYSEFRAHSLIPTASIVSSVVGAVSRLPLAKVLDVWGRAIGFALTLLIFTIGTMMMAACEDVVTYCVASVFFWTGFDGMSYALFVLIADHFPLRIRGIMFGLYNSPWLITTWIGAPVATAFLRGAGWRWSLGHFQSRQAPKPKGPSGRRTLWGSLKHYWIEFDCIGILLLTSGFSLFLLPFSLYTRQSQGWASPMIICMLVFGGVSIILFALWEKYLATKSFIPFSLLQSRTVIGASISYAETYMVYYCWTSYFSSSLQVVQGLSVTRAGYVFHIHNIGWVVAGIAAGALVKATGRYKWLALALGLPLQILATGLMIHLSKIDSKTSAIITVQIFLAIGDGIIYMSSVIAVMATVHHEHLASVLALYNMIGTTFQAVGATISVAIWTRAFPENLSKYLPASAQPNLMAIYSDLSTQLSYEIGSPERIAIAQGYPETMQKLFITGTSIISIGVISTVIWRDVKVSNEKRSSAFPL